MMLTEPASINNGPLVLSDQIVGYLNETRRWAKFLSIMGFIGVGIIVILALLIGSILNLISSMSPMPLPVPAFFFTLLYLAVALLYFFPVLYLYRFSTKMELALIRKDEIELAGSFENLKSMFKFMGIMTIVIISIYILAIVGVVMVAILMRH